MCNSLMVIQIMYKNFFCITSQFERDKQQLITQNTIDASFLILRINNDNTEQELVRL